MELLEHAVDCTTRHNTGERNGQILDEYLTTVCTLRNGKIARLETCISNIEMVNAYFTRILSDANVKGREKFDVMTARLARSHCSRNSGSSSRS
jgi:hypothetical protein